MREDDNHPPRHSHPSPVIPGHDRESMHPRMGEDDNHPPLFPQNWDSP